MSISRNRSALGDLLGRTTWVRMRRDAAALLPASIAVRDTEDPDWCETEISSWTVGVDYAEPGSSRSGFLYGGYPAMFPRCCAECGEIHSDGGRFALRCDSPPDPAEQDLLAALRSFRTPGTITGRFVAEHGPAELGALFLPAIQSMIAERSRNHADALERLMLFGSPRIDFTAMELRAMSDDALRILVRVARREQRRRRADEETARRLTLVGRPIQACTQCGMPRAYHADPAVDHGFR